MRFLVAIAFLFLFPNTSGIPWEEGQKLSWHSFEGYPNFESGAVAITASGISYRLKEDETKESVEVEVWANFYPEQSWFIPEMVNDDILAHEQLHFDITELYAREFKKRIAEKLKHGALRSSDIKDIYNTVNRELDAVQRQYDRETNYSQHHENQNIWEAHVAESLADLNKFK